MHLLKKRMRSQLSHDILVSRDTLLPCEQALSLLYLQHSPQLPNWDIQHLANREGILFLFFFFFLPRWPLPLRRLLSAMLVPKQMCLIERSQWESKHKSFFFLRSFVSVEVKVTEINWLDFIKYLHWYPTGEIWERTDYRAGRKIDKSDQSRRHGIE